MDGELDPELNMRRAGWIVVGKLQSSLNDPKLLPGTKAHLFNDQYPTDVVWLWVVEHSSL